MSIETCFLSMETDQPLGIFWADSNQCGVVNLDEFLAESVIDLSEEQANRYADRLEKFVKELRQLSS